LYADDLVLFFKEGQSIDDFLQGNSVFTFSGIKFAPEKCGWVEDKLKFLGSTLDLKTRELDNGQVKANADNMNMDKLKKFVGKSYSGDGPKD